MRIVITGRHGQVAQALARHLPSLGVELVTLARPAFDLADPAPLAAAIIAAKPDLVINPAAYTAVDRAEDEPELAHAVNAVAPGVIAAAAAAVGAPVVHYSTDYVFDGASGRPYLETDATGPAGVYGASKLAGERAVQAANPAHVILRTAWVCGPDGHNFLKTMLRFGCERPRLRVVDDQRGTPTFAADLAAATGAIARRLGTAPVYGVFHCTNAGATTWCGFARAIMAEAAARGLGPMAEVDAIATAEYPTKARRPANSVLDSGKLAGAYGIVLPDWRESLKASPFG
jgi:dTDP-4-dehydrorhamnose reductase